MLTTSITAASLFIGTALAIFFLIFRRKRPSTWVKVGTVSHLYIYPLKSGKCQPVDQATCQDMGFKVGDNLDRIFAVAKEGTYEVIDLITRRKLCLVNLNNNSGNITLEAPQMEDLWFSLPEDFEDLPRDKLIGTSDKGIGGSGSCSSAYDCGDEAARWLSLFLVGEETGLRLIYHHHKTSARTRGQEFALDKAFKETLDEARSSKPAFGNSTPYVVLSEASVDDLNLRLAKPVSPKQFRPNIVVQTLTNRPYQEDHWSKLRIGEAVFKFAHPNIRCPVINVDPDTGERDQRGPYFALKKYRCILSEDKKAILSPMEAAIFGSKYGLDQGGVLEVGQQVFALID